MTRHDDHGGFARDLRTMMQRRHVLRLGAGAAFGVLVGCSDDGSGDGDDDGGSGACTAVPQETGGPYPGDGSNGPNALLLAGITRSDIRTSIGDASGTAAGVPMTLTITLVDTDCAPLVGYAIYLWHCDIAGDYSMYTGAAKTENYLRGVQVTGSDGTVTFQSIFPACYSGRWPHIHFEVFRSVEAATSGGEVVRTSQIAMPEDACDAVFASAGYEESVGNFAQTSLDSDNVFRDGSDTQVADVSGSVDAGYTARLQVAVAV